MMSKLPYDHPRVRELDSDRFLRKRDEMEINQVRDTRKSRERGRREKEWACETVRAGVGWLARAKKSDPVRMCARLGAGYFARALLPPPQFPNPVQLHVSLCLSLCRSGTVSTVSSVATQPVHVVCRFPLSGL